jgi:uncharacterized protein (DUF58 family)
MRSLLEDAAFLSELEGLRLMSRKVFRGQMRGERRSRNKGQSVEFVDYRPYLAGDDLRRVDWNMYGRLERFYIKLFEEEEDLRIYVLLDCSTSMDYGTPNKFNQARKLAAGLSHIALSNRESVAISVFASGYDIISTPVRGKAKIHTLLSRLGAVQPSGASRLPEAVARFMAHTRKTGIVCVISDFLFAEGMETIGPLASSGHEILLMQVLAPEEANPQLAGDLSLIDSETGQALDVSMGINVLRKYHQRLTALQAELRTFALRGGGQAFIYNAGTPLRDFFYHALRAGKLLR